MFVTAAALLALAPGPAPRAIGYSLEAGRCSERLAAGATEAHSRLAVGSTARLSAVVRFSGTCGSRRKPVPCSAMPLQVETTGGLSLSSVRGTDIQLEARAPGRGAVTVRSLKKRFPPLGVRAAVPAALAARVRSSFPELRSLRIAEGGATTIALYTIDEEGRPLCAGGTAAVSAQAFGIGAGTAWDLAARQEVRAVAAPGWSFLELSLGGRRLSLPVEIVPRTSIERLALEPQRTGSGPIRVAVRASDAEGEVLGAPVRLWLQGDGSLFLVGHFDQPLRELETTDAEIALVPAHPGAFLILSAQMQNGITARLDLQAEAR